MSSTSDKPLVLKIELYGGQGGVIPKGVKETLLVEAVDGAAVFKFLDHITTRNFAKHGENVKNCRYVERLQKTICQYPGETKEEIMKSISKSLKEQSKT